MAFNFGTIAKTIYSLDACFQLTINYDATIGLDASAFG